MINICVACDENYAKYAGVLVASVLCNAASNDELSFYILDGGISEYKRQEILSLKSIKDCSINFIKIDNAMFKDYTNIKTHKYLSITAYYRLKLPTLLESLNRVIYLDCDMVVNAGLSALFNTDIGDNVVAGVKDINKKMLRKNPSYVNSGMLVMDLKAMRLFNCEEKFLEYTKEHLNEIKTGDQEIINEVLKNKIKIVDDEWNVQSSNFTNRSSYTANPKIIHFVAKQKPWHFGSFSWHKDYYFKYLQCTPWALNDEEKKYWYVKNKIISILKYIQYRPLFMLRPKYYEALYHSYLKPFFDSKKPVIKDNTFIVWEPCSKSHSEVVPGYAKYLLDLGYHVSVLVNPKKYKEGLFCRFNCGNISYNVMSRKQIRKFFKKDPLDKVKGVLVTTAGKLCDSVHFDEAYNSFNENTDKSKLLFVEHEAKHAVDAGTWRENLITLRELNYKGAKSIVVNPHYFGDVKITGKNSDITNFLTIGAIQGKKKNNELIINSVKDLHRKGYRNFKITVIGKGSIKHLPKELRRYFDIKGRLPFRQMYDEIEKADFMLTSYSENNPMHIRYNTTGTSGNFQLVYGFCKPCIIIESFGFINGFDNSNSILYNKDGDYSSTLIRGIDMTPEEYTQMQKNLRLYTDSLYSKSLENLRGLIND